MPKAIEERIDNIRELARQTVTDENVAALRKALSDRSNLVVAQAAKVIVELKLSNLEPDLLSAFERMLLKGASSDPKCWGKKAIIDSLIKMDYSDSAPIVKGLRHVQMEPVWGGQEDTATSLRGSCALALLQCGDITRHEKLQRLVDAMADSSEPVRVDAIRAVEQMEGDDAALLLRLKARTGDSKPRVIGQVLESLISLEQESGIRFVSEFLDSPQDEIREEAALALGASRTAGGFQALKEAWLRNSARGEIILRGISASGLPDAINFLLELIKNGLQRDADASVRALELYAGSEDIQTQVRDAIRMRTEND
jgi:HEAT repeat protein